MLLSCSIHVTQHGQRDSDGTGETVLEHRNIEEIERYFNWQSAVIPYVRLYEM